MKIVVYKVSVDLWRWAIKGENGNRVAVGLTWYSRKSDAKRGAGRFEQRYWNTVCELGAMPIEVIE